MATNSNFRLHGPNWLAEAELIEVNFPLSTNPGRSVSEVALRNLFLELHPFTSHGTVLAPGVLVILCAVKTVTLSRGPALALPPGMPVNWNINAQMPGAPITPGDIRAKVISGEWALLLAAADPAAFTSKPFPHNRLPELTCIAGEIALDKDAAGNGAFFSNNFPQPEGPFKQVAGAAAQNRTPIAAQLLASITANAGGISFLGEAQLPWQMAPVQGVFLLGPDDPPTNQLVKIESERLTDDERANLLDAWATLLKKVRGPGGNARPIWSGIEFPSVNASPNIDWSIEFDDTRSTWSTTVRLRGASLILTDISDPLQRQSFARLRSDGIRVTAEAGGGLKLAVGQPPAGAPPSGSLSYSAGPAPTITETWFLSDHELAFDPVGTAAAVREILGEREPATEADARAPSILWAAMPLENGWAQLPVPNFTEQMYIDRCQDAPVFHPTDLSLTADNIGPVFDGAVSYDNNALAQHGRSEQPWSLTISGADDFSASWTIDNSDVFQTGSIVLLNPRLLISGLLWLSREAPAAAHGLPELDDFATGLLTVPIESSPVAKPLAQSIPAGLHPWISAPGHGLDKGASILITGVKNAAGTFDTGDAHPLATNGNGLFYVDEVSDNGNSFKLAINFTAPGSGGFYQKVPRYPALIRIRGTSISFSKRQVQLQPDIQVPNAELQSCSFSYSVDAGVFAQMSAAPANPRLSILGKKVFGETSSPMLAADDVLLHLPALAWVRHPWLPMVQAVPLLQTQNPPNYPARERQYAPFELNPLNAAEAIAVFQLANARAWPKIVAPATLGAASEWAGSAWFTPPAPAATVKSGSDLLMACLSLPGLYLRPATPPDLPFRGFDGTQPEPGLGLIWGYRFDLPYCDEPHAYAKLPERPPPTQPDGADAAAPAPDPVVDRAGLEAYLLTQQERVALMAASAVDAVDADPLTNGTIVKGLAGSMVWPATLTAAFNQYPGSLTFVDPASKNPISLTGATALEGFSGTFDVSGRKLSLPAAAPANGYKLKSNSMEARADGGAYYDQLVAGRTASRVAGKLLLTDLLLAAGTVTLATALAPIPLVDSAGNPLGVFWFRDVPIQGGAFAAPAGPASTGEVNDPEARSADRNLFKGYEWRVAPASGAVTSGAVSSISLNGLDFYPLQLKDIRLDTTTGVVSSLTITARLQLPLAGSGELTAFANAVNAQFEPSGSGFALTGLSTFGTGVNEWPLALSETGEESNAPRLRWSTVKYSGGVITVSDVKMHFPLFGVPWEVVMAPLLFDAHTAPVDGSVNRFPDPGATAIAATRVELLLDKKATRKHTAAIIFKAQFGDAVPALATAEIKHPLQPQDPDTVSKVVLFGKPQIQGDKPSAILNLAGGGLQVQWADIKLADSLDFWPGATISTAVPAPGIANLGFSVAPEPAVTGGWRNLNANSGYAECMLFCRNTAATGAKGALSSSWCDLAIGASVLLGSTWKPKLLINGRLVVTNLVSWPLAMGFSGTSIQLPAADTGTPSLDHCRHTIEVLLNQHELHFALLVNPSDQAAIFTLAKPWEFSALVKHSLSEVHVPVNIDAGTDAQWSSRQLLVWVVPQSVRIASSRDTKPDLNVASGPDLLQPMLSTGDTWTYGKLRSAGYGTSSTGFQSLYQSILSDADHVAPDTLIVDASAAHWVRLPAPKALTVTFKRGGNDIPVTLSRSLVDPKSKRFSWRYTCTDQDPAARYSATVDLGTPDAGGKMAPLSVPSPLAGVLPETENFFALTAIWSSLDPARPLTLRVTITETVSRTLLGEVKLPVDPAESVSGEISAIQYLPIGNQMAVPSSDADFAPSDPSDPGWMLLPLPFLGRLQAASRDNINLPGATTTPITDPILAISRARAAGIAPLASALSLASWTWGPHVSFDLSPFDLPAGRLFGRLDREALARSMDRLRAPGKKGSGNQPEKTNDNGIATILAASPAGLAQYSRPDALSAALCIASTQAAGAAAPPTGYHWVNQQLLVIHASTNPAMRPSGGGTGTAPIHVWWPAGVLILQAIWASQRVSAQSAPAAAALTCNAPSYGTKTAPFAETLAASPYADIGFQQPDANATQSAIVLAEAIALPANAKPQPVATCTIENPANSTTARTQVQNWAAPMIARSVATASVAFVRLRCVFVDPADSSGIRVVYDYVSLPADTGLSQPLLAPLRSPKARIYFREGQFGGSHLPQFDRPIDIKTVDPAPSTALSVPAHGLDDGAFVHIDNALIDGVASDNKSFKIAIVDADIFEITGVLTLKPGEPATIRTEDTWKDNTGNIQNSVPIGIAPAALPQPAAHVTLTVSPPKHIATGDRVLISGVQGAVPPVEGIFEVTMLDLLNLTIPVTLTAAGSGGSLSRLSTVAVISDPAMLVRRDRAIVQLAAAFDPVILDRCPSLLISGARDIAGASPVNGIHTPRRPASASGNIAQLTIDFVLGAPATGGTLSFNALSAFELAPPQVTCVQAIREDTIAGEPWGISTLRVSTRATESLDPAQDLPGRGVIGRKFSDAGAGWRIWWQTTQHEVEFRTDKEKPGQCAGLPIGYRARAIDSLLPVNPRIPLPEPIQPGDIDWQPILPGNVTCMLAGARAGALLSLRSILVTQYGVGESDRRDSGVVSGSVPVRHRMPRPVLLPANAVGQEKIAVRTWGSYFAPTASVLVKTVPFDEAFVAEEGSDPATGLRVTAAFLGVKQVVTCIIEGVSNAPFTLTLNEHGYLPGDCVIVKGVDNRIVGAYVVTQADANTFKIDATLAASAKIVKGAGVCRCTSPASGLDLSKWDGIVYLDVEKFPKDSDKSDFTYDVQLVSPSSNSSLALTPPSVQPQPLKDNQFSYYSATPLGIFDEHLPAGSEVDIVVTVKSNKYPGFAQELRLPLRIIDSTLPPLPLAPRYLLFEDPEYNRQLATPAAQASVSFDVSSVSSKPDLITIQLSADRLRYNPDSTILWRFDTVDGAPPAGVSVTISAATLARIDKARNLQISPTILASPAERALASLDLHSVTFPGGPLQVGDQLHFFVTFTCNGKSGSATLPLRIVSDPLNPPTHSAYAIIRKLANGRDCPRFAWGPFPDRIVIVAPNDLKTGIIRRRAVFRWSLTERSDGEDPSSRYEIQKIAVNGGTHIP